MKSQRGIALITILVMVALATILAATIAKRQQHTFEQTAYLIHQNQAIHYAISAEAFVSELLVLDSETSGSADYLQEAWAQPLPPFPVNGAIITARLEDEAGKFNLNSLLKADGTPNEINQKIFENLLKRVGLQENLSQAVIDWQDADELTIGAMGAENNYYQGRANPYLAPNRPFFHKEELRLVRGFEGKNYDLIAPYISALPDINTKINANTAPALLLASLDEKLDVFAVETALKSQQGQMQHFKNIADVLAIAPFTSLDENGKKLANASLDVKSSFFVVFVDVQMSKRQRQLSSHLARKNNQVNVYSRSLAPF